jgi:hypothetical protein
MFTKLRETFSANRMAALLGLVLAASAFLATLQSSFIPGSPAAEAIGKAIVMLGSVAMAIKVLDKFLDGSQNWDSLMVAGVPKNAQVVAPPNAPGIESLDGEGDTFDDEEVEFVGVDERQVLLDGSEEYEQMRGFEGDSEDDTEADAAAKVPAPRSRKGTMSAG